MTLRWYCEQMGLQMQYRRVNGDIACELAGIILEGERIPASGIGPTKKAARAALAAVIAGHILQETVRPTTLYWVPAVLDP